MSDQLSLFEPKGNGRPMTKAEVGLRDTRPGAERLLAALVKRGLPEGDLRVAAGLCLALDGGADR
jgi:hypothetical protein